jgi:hypothetical protein
MSNVFANALEISGKAVGAKTIAAFPDVCFTPPENPATPPGVPVPYPSFGFSSDTENGTTTVKIGGKIVNIKNKSDLTKTSGTEAGCAAKKGVITSKNTGKEYFNSWSNDVKFEGEPVIRFTDLATNNHASPQGNTPPWLHVCAANFSPINCVQVLADNNIQLHQHEDSPCTPPDESEHFCENQMFQTSRGGANYPAWGSYNVNKAPCICMRARHQNPDGSVKEGTGSKRLTEHWGKTKHVRDRLRKEPRPKLRKAMKNCLKGVKTHHPEIKGRDPKTQEHIMECLRLVMLEYLRSVAPQKPDGSGGTRPQTDAELLETPVRTP